MRAKLPAGVFVRHATTLEQKISNIIVARERQAELFNVFRSLAQVLNRFHQSNLFVRDIIIENIVYVRFCPTKALEQCAAHTSRELLACMTCTVDRSSETSCSECLQSTLSA